MTSQNSADAGAPIADVPAPDAPVPGAPASAVVPADQANPAFAAATSAASAATAAGHTEAPLAQASPTQAEHPNQAGHPAQAVHPTQAGRRRRRVVHLGPKDRERVAEGANLEQIVQEALGKVDAERPAWSREDLRREDPSAHANDARLLGDVPPHYGNGA
ncbi:hypothetical protein CJ186_05980 [Actinomyces graevenitzii]|uniref:hypothetical protein n=1 Tax=Actinomyces graevenitzii TaxID=55565 RepID=UPI000C80F5CA|nr:hypothetical protein [Actinomyces graevenitzii]PMC91631.1 hypothetical protein CJ186_05980 [Actinomyces graevenitzii]